MTFQEFIKNIEQLETNKDYPYVPSSTSLEKKYYRLISVSEESIIVEREEKKLNVSIPQIKQILEVLKKDTPLDIEQLLGGSGNTRSIVESLLCLTPTVFYTKVKKRKNIYDSSTKKHNLGILEEYSLEYTAEKLGQILKNMYDNAEKGFQAASIHMFGIEYAPYISNKISVSDIVNKSGLSANYETEVSKGIKIYECLTSGKYELQYEQLCKKKANKDIFPINKITLFVCDSIFTSDNLLRRYISSLLAKPFTILTGNSGTGKTRIATQLADWLKKETDSGVKNSRVVPVGADWTDNTKILGYFNPLANNGTGEFIKSEILEFIEMANDNPKIPFFLILDEMNLSHVERYFSDFLSAMESGKPILLYKKPDGCECEVEETITLPENLFVTGTVNIDETTYMFSPKVLDRANVIEFIPPKEDIFKIFTDEENIKDIEPAADGVAEAFVELANKIRTGKEKPEQEKLDIVSKFLNELYDILKPSGFEFAYRTTKEIYLYCCASYSLNAEAKIESIIDEQIVQKILPKIHGNKKQIETLLKDLETKLNDQSKYPLSYEKVKSMQDKLEKFQYASFI